MKMSLLRFLKYLSPAVLLLIQVSLNGAPVDPRAKPSGERELRISFEQAENEVLVRFRQDLPRIEALTTKLAIYEAKASGDLPANYSESFRNKLSRIVLTSNKLHLMDCSQCQVSRLIKDPEGQLRYEAFSEEPGRPAKVAAELKVSELLYADLQYNQSDLRLRVRLVTVPSQEVLWTAEYSTSDLIKDRGKLVEKEYDMESIGRGDSLSQVIVGEIAFSCVFSPGIIWVPTIDEGRGSSRVFMPSVDLVIGEKYDSGHKRFGFLFGGAFNAADGSTAGGKMLPWMLRIAPQYRYTFNPYNTSTIRYSIAGEIGGLISASLVTAYAAVGPEFQLVKRFSVSAMPMYILPTTVKGGTSITIAENGQVNNQAQPDQGKFGGFGVIIKGSLNW
jgi:hypothetical protein